MARQAKRHGRRGIRSSITGASLPDPDSRITRFELDARAALEVLKMSLPDELRGLKFGFATAPPASIPFGQRESGQPIFYSVDRRNRTIVLYRMPIQRAEVLHVDDAEHRRLFVGHCVYRAVCEYLGANPWDLLPGRFDHF